ncbi:MAG: GntR family transcriptional regulator [Methylobacteriaceae bacterium]|nr:GntR family transcriptional regulator [Methylobacteriaceae bacterium]
MGSSAERIQQLTGRIIEAVRQDGLEPGSRLPESRLAERLGVSRGPIRAGLRRLEQVGLARQKPGWGYVLVRPLEDDAARQLLDEASTSESRYMQIAGDRLDGLLQDVVSEGELMRRYGLTRPELGRLLDRIASEGWIARQPGYGWRFAASLSDPDGYAQTIRLRLMIEPAGLLEPGFALDPVAAAAVRRQQERVLAGDSRATPAEMFRFGCDFHETLARASGNPFLVDALQRLNTVRRLFVYRSLLPDRVTIRRQSAEHLALLSLLEAGKRQDAAALMVAHLEDAASTRPSSRATRR